MSIIGWSQCNPDTQAPTFTVPTYPDTIYPSLQDCPDYEEVLDLTYATLEDNCLSPDVAPWYGPTMVSTPGWDLTDTSITHRFAAYDDGPNWSDYQTVTFYFHPSGLGIPEISLEPGGAVEYYDLRGVQVTEDTLERGQIYLRKVGSHVTKVIRP